MDTEQHIPLRKSVFAKLCALIPAKISNKTVVRFFELLRKCQRLLRKNFSANFSKNELTFLSHKAVIYQHKGFVEDQNSYTDMAYGKSTMQYSGCEIFATFNAMYSILGRHLMSLPQMISEYEKDGMVLSGKFGTSPRAISDFLRRQGFTTRLSTLEAEFDAIGWASQALILTMYNDRTDIRKEVHTVCISKDDSGFTAHNVYCNGTVVGPCGSVTELIGNINTGKAKGISLIGINGSHQL